MGRAVGEGPWLLGGSLIEGPSVSAASDVLVQAETASSYPKPCGLDKSISHETSKFTKSTLTMVLFLK